jgi:hypothetical protein
MLIPSIAEDYGSVLSPAIIRTRGANSNHFLCIAPFRVPSRSSKCKIDLSQGRIPALMWYAPYYMVWKEKINTEIYRHLRTYLLSN